MQFCIPGRQAKRVDGSRDETNETNREIIIMLWTIVEQSEMSECDENNNNMSEKLCIVR